MLLSASSLEDAYHLGFDGGGTKTECVLADAEGRILARETAGPSNPLRSGYARAWFALSEAGDKALSRHGIRASQIRGICAGLGGAGRARVARQAARFFEGGFPKAQVRVTSDLEIAFEAAFGGGEGILLLAGTGSAALGRDAMGRTARSGGRGPWFSDEGSAFDIGRHAFAAVVRAEERRGPATELSGRILAWHQCGDWDALLESVAKNPDAVFPATFPLAAELADHGDEVARGILSEAAASLAGLVACVARGLGWEGAEFAIARIGGVHGRSSFLDAALGAELKRVAPRAGETPVTISPAEAAARMAIRAGREAGRAV